MDLIGAVSYLTFVAVVLLALGALANSVPALKPHRTTLLVCGGALLVISALPTFIHGFIKGFEAGAARAR